MVKSGLKVKKDITKRVMKDISKVMTRDVLVGIPAEEGTRRGLETTNPQLGYIHENGAPEANIPPRPFLLPGVRAAQSKVVEFLRIAANAQLSGNDTKAEKALHAAGFTATVAVQRRIHMGPFVPLKASTLRRRRARGRTGTKPLIDTAQLLRSIVHVVRNKRAGS